MAEGENARIQVDLTGRTAIVTGASRGIGRAIALRLAESGAKVACIARNLDKLEEVAGEIRALGAEATVHQCDVTDTQQVQETVDSIHEDYGNLHILVNNAGITRDT
ncbi:MAG: SDR family NAD(P)-dependent oxidoreductase, partial [Planctomycetales bacterium]|nr:SDR family NAD(P)-dependent oxidoreductase [Planctomycetales bacterium]